MKDPAFLFYSSDFLSGTMLMSDEDVGKYIRLLCLQHQKGHLREKDMLNICGGKNDDIFDKFSLDDEGNYYNIRLEEEIIRRKNYSESRRKNREKKKKEKDISETYEEDMNNICNSHDEHMETETETETITINKTINENINKNKKKKIEKIKFAEFVSMKEEEYDKLVEKYGEKFTKECIEVLDNYKGANGKKYRDDYRAILNWVVDRVKEKPKDNRKNVNWFAEIAREEGILND